MTITPEPYQISADDAVELVGRSFQFTHQKGIVEWVKNSWDAYQRRADLADTDNSGLVLQFSGASRSFREVLVIDWCGATSDDIQQSFMKWFDSAAATRNSRSDSSRILGGHGNGGKYYMREMFSQSRFTTYFGGKINRFGFNPDKEYGYEAEYKDFDCSPEQAFEIAQITDGSIPGSVLSAIKDGRTGFTVVHGTDASGVGAQRTTANVIESLRQHPQMARLLPDMNVAVWNSDQVVIERLLPITPDSHTEIDSREFELPENISYDDQGFDFAHESRQFLKVEIAAASLTGSSRKFNRLDIVGGVGIIASYDVSVLPVSAANGSDFLRATLTVPAAENESESLVDNAREHLIASPKSAALLSWVGTQLAEVAQAVAQHNAEERQQTQAAETARLTRELNKYAEQFLRDFYTDVSGGGGSGTGFGGTGGGGQSTGGGAGSGGNGRRNTSGDGDDGGGSGDAPGRTRRFPQVLVAGVDPDPFSESGETLSLNSRYPTLYQRNPKDVDARIYWINTEAVYPKVLLDSHSETSVAWKNYVLLRHRDVVVKEALRHITESEGLDFTLEVVDNRIDELTDRFLNSLDQEIADSILSSE